jgi:hypothetical protein
VIHAVVSRLWFRSLDDRLLTDEEFTGFHDRLNDVMFEEQESSAHPQLATASRPTRERQRPSARRSHRGEPGTVVTYASAVSSSMCFL